jgi:rsbT co-antagonist protein RsbR
VGVLIFSWSAPHQCSPQEQKIYNALTGLGSSAVESRRLLGQTESALARTDTLYNISRNLNAALDEEALLQVLARPAVQAGASEADLYYIEAGDSGELEWMEKIAAWQREGEPKTPVGTRYHMPEYPFTLRYIEKPDELQCVANIATDERLGDHLKNLMARLGTKSMVTLPLAQAGRLVGLVIIQWNELHEFGTQEVETYTDLTNMAASAVVSRRLVSSLENMVAERTADLEHMLEETARLQQEIIEAQQQAIRELSTPIIPVMNAPDGAGGIIIMPLVGSIDSTRARDITRALLAGIRAHRATVVIMDITGVPLVDSGVAAYLNKTIQAAQLKGARTIITGISEAVAETIVDLGIDWSRVETLSDLRTGLLAALDSLGIGLTRKKRRGG